MYFSFVLLLEGVVWGWKQTTESVCVTLCVAFRTIRASCDQSEERVLWGHVLPVLPRKCHTRIALLSPERPRPALARLWGPQSSALGTGIVASLAFIAVLYHTFAEYSTFLQVRAVWHRLVCLVMGDRGWRWQVSIPRLSLSLQTSLCWKKLTSQTWGRVYCHVLHLCPRTEYVRPGPCGGCTQRRQVCLSDSESRDDWLLAPWISLWIENTIFKTPELSITIYPVEEIQMAAWFGSSW